MTHQQVRAFSLKLNGVTEDFPFDEHTLAFRIGGKIFLLTGLNDFPATVNIKCNPERAIELREEYEEIIPGYHMNKKHWNTVNLEGNLSESLIKELIKHSYELVKASLPKVKKIS